MQNKIMNAAVISTDDQMEQDNFIDDLTSLPTLQSSEEYVTVLKKLNAQLNSAVANGLSKNRWFAFRLIQNLHRVIPLFGNILSNESKENDDVFRETNQFLGTIAKSFDGVCLFEIFIICDDTSIIECIFKNHIELIKESYFTDSTKYDNLLNCLFPTVGYPTLLITVTEERIPANLLQRLLTFAQRHWKDRSRELLMKNILALIKLFSKNPFLVQMVIRNEWLDACLGWLDPNDSGINTRPSYMIDYLISLIIQKLAQHTIAVPVLRQLNCLKRLTACQEAMKKCHTEMQYNCLHVLHCMISALLLQEDEIKQISLENDHVSPIINELVLNIIDASHNEYFFYKCFHISEMLIVLAKLFVNDEILIKFVDEHKQLFDCLCQLVIHHSNLNQDKNRIIRATDGETLLSLINILWSISFHKCYQENFRNNPILIDILMNFATSSSLNVHTKIRLIPRDISSLKKAAEGILWNLKAPSSLPKQMPDDKQQQQPLVMISYSHSDSAFCRQLVEQLSMSISVWVDYKQAHDTIAHSDDLWEEIARAMEMATVIVLIISQEYYNSKSCRQELSYAADVLKKRIVPVYAPNQQYRASGWLGIRIAGQKYIHFGRKPFEHAIAELSSTITNDYKSTNVTVTQSATPLPPLPSSSECNEKKCTEIDDKLMTKLKNWTKDDIKKWFNENHIHNDLITLYIDQFRTGTALVVYARHLKLFYRYEYIRIFKRYRRLFQGRKLDTFDFITFVDALYRLRAEHDPNSVVEDRSEKFDEQQLPSIKKNLDEMMTRL